MQELRVRLGGKTIRKFQAIPEHFHPFEWLGMSFFPLAFIAI
jgi:hypothetical protein